jgi:ElaB/YqjD/DUF883 family membrane-anchored ribosome-binding protein
MATKSDTPGTDDITKQVEQIREDISTLTRLLTEVAGAKAEETKGLALEQAEELIRKSKAQAVAAQQQAETAFHSVERYIEEKPVQSATMALLAGLFIGWWSRR